MAVSGYLSAELAATCNALGFYDGQKYHLEPHCKETIRDLIRYLRRDEGGSHEIRRYLGNAKILQTDLLPMVQNHHSDVQLFDIALRLIVNLTNPALLVYNEVIPTDKFEHNYYLEIVSHLQQYKEAFNDHRAWTPFTERLSALLGRNVEDRSEEDQRTIERILIVIRNVLHVPSSADTDQRPDNDASLHDQVLWGLHQSGMIDLLLYVSSCEQEALFFMHLLEIICLMLREQPPELLAKTASQRSAEEKNKDDEELLKIRQLELQARMKKNKKYLGTRHSNFGGTFIIKNMKSTSDNYDLIYHKPIHDSKYISLDSEKKPVKLPKNRQPLKCVGVERKSALSVRLILKQVCVEFLNAAYNPLMRHVRECFHRGRAQENDESYYFTAMRFFMEFNRNYHFQVKYVSETLSVQTFQFIQKYLETWHEMMLTDKKKLPLWSYRSHLALRAYKELLHNLAFMDRSTDLSVRESSKVIKSNIFYVIEYREMLLTLINLYKREKYSRKYLIDLMETVHIFTKLLCDHCKGRKMVIQKTAVRRKKKSKKIKPTSAQDQASAETIWNLACDDVALVLTSPIDCEVVPFDATLEMDMNQQKLEAIKKIQSHLKNGDYKQAAAMLRASREVWPENDTFGSETADTFEELEILKDIFLADLGAERSVTMTAEEADGSEEDEEGDNYPLILEQNFDLIDFIKRFASPKVVRICNTLLSTYATNSETTNHCIVKMLYRIAWECKVPAMLFQASLFIKFRNILANYEPKHKELAKLAVFITRKFTEVAATNKTVFVELLFPKHVKDACEIVDGYGTYQDSKNKRVAWEEHEEDELRRLDEEFKATNVQGDKVDWILENLINKDRAKRSVIKKMKELGLEVPVNKPKGFWETEQEEELKKLYEECDKDLPEKLIVNSIYERMTTKEHSERAIKKKMIGLGLLQKPVKKLKQWSEEQDEELTELYNAHKNDDDIMGPIMAALGSQRSRQNIVGALLRLGLISDKKELRKKSKKSRASKSIPGDRSSDSEDSETDDESEDETGGGSSSRNQDDAPPRVGPSAAALYREMSQSKHLAGGLKWLVSSLNDNLLDLDADVFDSDVPLLPLSEEPVLSMENPVFLNFLHAVGFKKPVQHQEVYWRVSSSWREADFKLRIELMNFFIDNADRSLYDVAEELNRKLSAAVGEEVNVLTTDDENGDRSPRSDVSSGRNESNSSQNKSKVFENKQPKKSRMQDFVVERGHQSSDSDSDGARSRSTVGSRRKLNSESGEEADGSRNRSPFQAGTSRDHSSSAWKKKMMSLGQDSDDEEAVDDEGLSNDPTRPSPRRRVSSESSDDEKSQYRKVTTARDDSDDGDVGRSFSERKLSRNESASTASASKKKRLVLDSDDEEIGSVTTTLDSASDYRKNETNSDIQSSAKKRARALESDSDDEIAPKPVNGVSDAPESNGGSERSLNKKRTAAFDSDSDVESSGKENDALVTKIEKYQRKKVPRILESDDDE